MSSLAFELPRELEARRPPEARGLSRDAVRMLVSDVRSGTHALHSFVDLAVVLRAGDLLVVNDSATIPAAIDARRRNGTTVVIHLSTRISARVWIVEPRKTPLVETGERFTLPAGGSITLLSPVDSLHTRLWYALLDTPHEPSAYFAAYARPIRYDYVDESYPIAMYQTIFAREPGSVEMPSAARPFTLRVVDSLYSRGINLASITLHCGVASPETHEAPLDERFAVPDWTAQAIAETKHAGGRVIAIGTTVVRALESSVDAHGAVQPRRGWTNHIVDRQHPPVVADGLLTGFHEPRASHLSMLEAFASAEVVSHAYREALERGLLWHEFGDVHLLMR